MADIGSTSGRWFAFIEPITSRRYVFHLVRHTPHRVDEKGKVTPAVDHEVELAFHKLEREGEWGPAPPTMVSNFGSDGAELEQMLQAIVDEAAKIGIVAKGHRDHTAELAATRDHLEDMRRMALNSYGYEKLPQKRA